ncbi:hypothetical protein ACFV3O_29430, partial [Streptomyces albidoflavus]
MAPARAEELVGELTAFAAEAGSPLEEEFGPAGELADQLTRREGADAVDGPGDGPDTWVGGVIHKTQPPRPPGL